MAKIKNVEGCATFFLRLVAGCATSASVNTTQPMSKQVILTAPVEPSVQKKVRDRAKSHNIPIRVFCAMLIKQGLSDLDAGRIEISKPGISTAQ